MPHKMVNPTPPERRQGEDAQVYTIRRFNRILSDMRSAVLLISEEGRVEFANQALCECFRLQDAPADLLDLPCGDMVEKIKSSYRHPEEAASRIHEIVGRGEHVLDEEIEMADGRTFLREFVPMSLNGRPDGWLWLHTDISDRKKIEDTLRFLAQSGAAPDVDFFQSLAAYLARTLGMDYVCIDRLEEGSLSAQTVAVYFDGKFEENVSYTLKDTPCGDVVKDKICCFPRGVRHRYPKDQVLQDMQAESYVGTILWGSQGQPIGLIAVLGRQPLAKPELATAILQLAAVRAAGELERREAENALRYAVDELARSNKDLETFAYLASHDLQSPLRQVTGMINFLRERYHGQLDAKADECMDLAVAATDHMSELITDLLTYSRLGSKELEAQDVNLQEPVFQALKLLRNDIDAAGAKVAVPELPKVQAHPGELAQVFENLIGNAVKFRSDRPVEIEVGAKPDDNGWLVWVKDNGIGLDPQHKEKAFELFRRLHDRSKYPGTGIGLAICKKIVERHGGRIWVESVPGNGATFFFTLPA